MRQALLVIAHPDDELLWFGGTVLVHTDVAWTVVCATYSELSGRGSDFLNVCRELGADGILLGLDDIPGALVDEAELEQRLSLIARERQWDLVLTHNSNGEYGHIHHRQVSRIVRKHWPGAIQSGFGTEGINAILRLPEGVAERKRRLADLYRCAGKNSRMRLYPSFALDFEPSVVPEGIELQHAVRVAPTTWQEVSGMSDLARRKSDTTCRVAVLADTRGWAHNVIISNVRRNLPPELDLEIFFLYNEDFTQQLPVAMRAHDYDVIHLLSWRYWPLVRDWGLPADRLVTTLIGHRGVDGRDSRFLETMGHFARVSVVSSRLYRELSPVIPNLFLTPCGVDTQTFVPGSREVAGGFTVGAVGRHYVEPGESDDIKGWQMILDPLATRLNPLQARYLKIDRAAVVPHGRMSDFYRQLHCFLCASRSEGLPLPLLEAASCGLILLSTDVGVARQLIVEGENGRLLPREIDAFAKAIRELAQQPERWVAMGRYSRELVLAGWDWWSLAPRWAEFYLAER